MVYFMRFGPASTPPEGLVVEKLLELFVEPVSSFDQQTC